MEIKDISSNNYYVPAVSNAAGVIDAPSSSVPVGSPSPVENTLSVPGLPEYSYRTTVREPVVVSIINPEKWRSGPANPVGRRYPGVAEHEGSD